MTDLKNYLRCPIVNGRVNKTIFHRLIENTNEQLAKWKASSISQAGRAILINANISAKPNFLMQSFMLPAQMHKELDKTNRRFFGNKDANYSPLIG